MESTSKTGVFAFLFVACIFAVIGTAIYFAGKKQSEPGSLSGGNRREKRDNSEQPTGKARDAANQPEDLTDFVGRIQRSPALGKCIIRYGIESTNGFTPRGSAKAVYVDLPVVSANSTVLCIMDCEDDVIAKQAEKSMIAHVESLRRGDKGDSIPKGNRVHLYGHYIILGEVEYFNEAKRYLDAKDNK
jgi:hypothetical protein